MGGNSDASSGRIPPSLMCRSSSCPRSIPRAAPTSVRSSSSRSRSTSIICSRSSGSIARSRQPSMPSAIAVTLLAGLLQTSPTHPLDNDYVRVTRNGAPCSSASPSVCGERVLVALGPIEFRQYDQPRRLQRGEIAVFRWHESYVATTKGEFLEVSIKVDHPAVQRPAVVSPPETNAMLYDGETFLVFEERLPAGETRARHGHSQHLVIVLNDTRLQEWRDGEPEVIRAQIADEVRFYPAVTHVVKTVGEKPLRNIVIEFKA